MQKSSSNSVTSYKNKLKMLLQLKRFETKGKQDKYFKTLERKPYLVAQVCNLNLGN